MRLNTRATFPAPRTHEGGAARRMGAREELLRAAVNCLLWEPTFYESGSEIAEHMADLARRVDPDFLARLAVYCRNELGLRHVSLYLARLLARHARGPIVSDTIARVVRRADELGEFVAIYWATNDGRRTLSSQVKKGLARAFHNFDAYQLAKYAQRGVVRLRDVMFLVHPRPRNPQEEELFRKLADDELKAPETWEKRLSAGEDKRQVFEELLREGRLGTLALLRNLRNMLQAGVDPELIAQALERANWWGVLPFQIVAAYRAVRESALLEARIREELARSLKERLQRPPRLKGRTIVLVDVSGSMEDSLSRHSILTRMDAAAAQALILTEACDEVRLFTFSNRVVEVPPARGLELVDLIENSQPHGGTWLRKAVEELSSNATLQNYDRIVVLTDEQSHDGLGRLSWPRGYVVNLAPYRPGLETDGRWQFINGFSERLTEWMVLTETGLQRHPLLVEEKERELL